jgi:hypothetical protein
MLLLEMKTLEFWKPVIASVAMTPVLLLFAVMSIGPEGTGGLLAAKVLFPYTLLSEMLPDPISDFLFYPMLLFAVVQFPLYGLVLSLSGMIKKLRLLAIGLAVAHVLAAALCLLFFGTQGRQFEPRFAQHNNGLHPTRISMDVIRKSGANHS